MFCALCRSCGHALYISPIEFNVCFIVSMIWFISFFQNSSGTSNAVVSSLEEMFLGFLVSWFLCLSMVSIAYQCCVSCRINAVSSAVFVAVSLLTWHICMIVEQN